MATVNRYTFKHLKPLRYNYSFFKNEDLLTKSIAYSEGYNFNVIEGLQNYRDIASNKGSYLVLTDTISLSSIFKKDNTVSIGQMPGTIKIISVTNNNYARYDNTSNTFVTDVTSNGLNFFIQPITSNVIEIKANNKYLQIDKTYPYTVRLGEEITTESEIYRQRFYCIYSNNILTIRVQVNNTTQRYLAFDKNDNILRATGVMLNNVSTNCYTLSTEDVTSSTLNYNFTPTNDWVTYYYNFITQTDNNTLTVNNTFKNNLVNLLIDFPFEQAITTGIANINIANLKTGYTPTDNPPQIDNSSVIEAITTN
jgi:hypothetical protein